MRRTTLEIAAFAAAFVLCACVAPVFAQKPQDAVSEDDDAFVFDRACMDDYGRDLCDEGNWTDIVARFGLDSAEIAQRKGLRGVRVFTIDGYSNDMPAVLILASTFNRDGKPNNAELEVRRQPFRDERKAAPPVLKREARSDLYEAARDLQALVTASPERQVEDDKGQTSRPGDEDEQRLVTICLHAWVTVTESLTDEGVTRRIRNACGSDPLFETSYGMSARALDSFAYCSYLDPENYRNESAQLERCFSIDGLDKIAAAEVTTIFDASIDDATDLGPYLSQDVRLRSPDGARISGASAVEAALTSLEFEEPYLYAEHFVGAHDRVVAGGWLYNYIDDGVETADIEFTWQRHGNSWRIADIVIGPAKMEE